MTLLLDIPDRASRHPRSRAISRARLLLLVVMLLAMTFCWWARGRGYMHAIKGRILPAQVKVQHQPPKVVVSTPPDGATDVALDTVITADIDSSGGLAPTSVTANAALLIRTSDQTVVASSTRFTEGRKLELHAARPLQPGTNYTFYVPPGLMDNAGRRITPYAIAFSTAAQADPVIRFEQLPQPASRDVGFTCLQVGPDENLYASSDDGRIFHFAIAPDGTLGSRRSSIRCNAPRAARACSPASASTPARRRTNRSFGPRTAFTRSRTRRTGAGRSAGSAGRTSSTCRTSSSICRAPPAIT
jgi:hypothetical protein